MLRSIRNIEPGSDFRKAGKFDRFGNMKSIVNSRFGIISDSKEFSPALDYLAQSNCKLANLKISNDNIIVTLKIDEFEISTSLDLLDILSVKELNYEVTKTNGEGSGTKACAAEIKSYLSSKVIGSRTVKFNLDALRTLFNNYLSLNTNAELTRTDTTIIKNLTDDIKPELEELFGHINKIFLTFTGKLISKPVIDSIANAGYINKSIELISIKTVKV